MHTHSIRLMWRASYALSFAEHLHLHACLSYDDVDGTVSTGMFLVECMLTGCLLGHTGVHTANREQQ